MCYPYQRGRVRLLDDNNKYDLIIKITGEFVRFVGTSINDMTTKLTKKKITIANSFSKSTGSMSGKLKKSANELPYIEAEYIKSLQRHIYFLELETNYIREQARKATGKHPHMMQEAENMLDKLKKMQSELDRMNLEMKQHDINTQENISEKERIEELLMLEKENHEKEKTLLTEELVTMRKEIDRHQRELTCRNNQMLDIKRELDRSAIEVNNDDMKINSLKNQIDQRIEQHNITQITLEEKTALLLTTKAQLREIEEKYIFNAFIENDEVHEDLRNKICILHQKLKETELEAEKSQLLRDKTLKDIENIVVENSTLNLQLIELKRELEKETELRNSASQHHSRNMAEVATLKETTGENDFLRNHLEKEQEKSRQYLEQMTNEKTSSEENKQQITIYKTCLSELEVKQKVADSDNSQLRKEKFLLVDHVSELNKKIEDNDREIVSMMASAKDMETRLSSVDLQKSLELVQHSQNLEHFSNLADSMKSLAQSMMVQTSHSVKSPGRMAQLY